MVISCKNEPESSFTQPNHYFCRLPWGVKAPLSSFVTLSSESSPAPFLAIMTMSRGAVSSRQWRRKNSLRSLLIRLRMTALPTLALPGMPSLFSPLSFALLRITKREV